LTPPHEKGTEHERDDSGVKGVTYKAAALIFE